MFNKKKEDKMDFKKMLLDTTDQQNHARWTGAIYALRDLTSHMRGLLKNAGCTHKSFSSDMVQYVGKELKRYKELSETTDMGKKMKELGIPQRAEDMTR
jgi:hypothetical protein